MEVEWHQKEAGLAEVTDRLSSQVAGLQEELKDQEAETIMRVRASMANKFLLGKTDTKYLQTLVDDYLRFGSIKDLESEGEEKDGEKEDMADALASTANSGSTGPAGEKEVAKEKV